MKDLRRLIIYWNNTFPFDRLYRQKHNISFGSEEHRKVNQIDVYLDILEDRMFIKYNEEQEENRLLKEAYIKDGILNQERNKVLEESLDEVFDSLDVEDINKETDE